MLSCHEKPLDIGSLVISALTVDNRPSGFADVRRSYASSLSFFFITQFHVKDAAGGVRSHRFIRTSKPSRTFFQSIINYLKAIFFLPSIQGIYVSPDRLKVKVVEAGLFQ